MAWYIWLKFCLEYRWNLGVDWKKWKKIVTELGHSDCLKIYINLSKIFRRPWHSRPFKWLILWNHRTMVLKFHMQHDKAAGLQNDEIQHDQESKMATVAGMIKSYSRISQTSDFWGRTSKNLPFSSPRTTGFFQSTCPKLLSLRCQKVLFLVISYYLLPVNRDVWSPSWLDTCFLKTLHISVQPVFILLFCY